MLWSVMRINLELGDPPFFFSFLLNLMIFYLQSKIFKNLYVGNFGRERP